jgi:hypothetical protein
MDKTIVNVKGISVPSWDRGKAAANRAGETMGSWLSRAIDQLADREAGQRYIPPDAPANPPTVQRSEIDLREVAAVLVAMGQAGVPVQTRVGSLVNAILYTRMREAHPARLRISGGLTEGENGKA